MAHLPTRALAGCRERHTGLYPIMSYLLAKMSGELVAVLPTSAVLAGGLDGR